MSTVHLVFLSAWPSSNMSNTCQWPASYHCNVTGKYKSGRSDNKCRWESMEAGGSLCTPQFERAGYSFRPVSRDFSSLRTLVHRSLNLLPLASVTKLPLKTRQEAQAPGWWDPISWAAKPSSPLVALEEASCPAQQTRLHKPPRLVPNAVPTSQTGSPRNSHQTFQFSLLAHLSNHYSMPTAKVPQSAVAVRNRSFYKEGLGGSMSWLRCHSFEKPGLQVQKNTVKYIREVNTRDCVIRGEWVSHLGCHSQSCSKMSCWNRSNENPS